MQRAVTPKIVPPVDTRPTIELWLGGDWQLSRDGEVIPVTAHVPNPSAQRQFMAHDENGIRLDHEHGKFGHRPVADAEVSVCPPDYFEAIVAQEVRDMRAFYGDKTDPKYVEEKIAAKVGMIRAKHEARGMKVAKLLAERLAVTDAATIAAGKEAEARLKARSKGAGA